MEERVRSVDVSKMSIEQADSLTEQLGQKVTKICDEAVENVNKILNIYGMAALMQIKIDSKENIEQMKNKAKTQPKLNKKPGRRKKQANL